MSPGAEASSLLVHRLRRGLLDVLSETVGSRQRVALVGFPDHPNVGDSAIWLGELEALKKLRTAVALTCSAWGYDPDLVRWRLGPGGKILLHGGGNLGDEWPEHQRLRERVIADLADLPVVQLPQSVHFNAPESLERARTVFDAHPDLTLLCRDPRSAEVAEREFHNATTRLCPDAAFGSPRGDPRAVRLRARPRRGRRGRRRSLVAV
jgi:pyruvyl transferase EpsO